MISCCYFTYLIIAGHSSENKNVGIWDTLLPQKKALITCKFVFFFIKNFRK